MSNKNELNRRRLAKHSHDGKHKRKNYTSEVYGARLAFEDARVLDDYGKANKLDRSDVVRRGLHQFARWLQLSHHKKDPLRETLEQAVAEKIEPLSSRVEALCTVLPELAEAVIQIKQTTPKSVESVQPQGEFSREQKQLIEQTLMAAMLALRLHINYIVEPVLRELDARGRGKADAYLQAAIQGRDGWSETTREVISRTGNRILFELNLITKEDWERMLDVYQGAKKG